ncbi:MAG: Zn-ribbon domain-containing OB-fold protein [Pseudomonadales bacterium]|nr:Zn-ribbon domain-containing OB-fold protein [Pseudomonadales bacterium]
MADKSKIPLPQPTPETQHFWDGAKAGELRLQQCNDCSAVYFPPRPFCPTCGHREVSVIRASGKGKLYSYIINHRPHPAFDGPYSIAVVELDEGPRMMTNIVNTPQAPESLTLDMPVVVTFESMSDDISLPYFEPAANQSASANGEGKS